MLLDQLLLCSRLSLNPAVRSDILFLAGEPNSGFDGLGLRKVLSGSLHNLLFHLFYLHNANKIVPLPTSFMFDFWSQTDFCWNLMSTTYLCEFQPVILRF